MFGKRTARANSKLEPVGSFGSSDFSPCQGSGRNRLTSPNGLEPEALADSTAQSSDASGSEATFHFAARRRELTVGS